MLRRGAYRARMARDGGDIAAAQALRHRCFIAGTGAAPRGGGRDVDGFDTICRHVLVEDVARGRPVCCFRLLPLQSGQEIARSYAAQFYDLSALARFRGPMAELGRFCIDPACASDPDILRVAWGAMTRFVDARGIEMLFGCSSFRGTDAGAYRDAFALLGARHAAPDRWRPRVKAPEVIRLDAPRTRCGSAAGLRTMPPLLRTYLAMGGWVSDHAVVDRDLNTLHVFTGLEIAAVPPARARALRAVAG